MRNDRISLIRTIRTLYSIDKLDASAVSDYSYLMKQLLSDRRDTSMVSQADIYYIVNLHYAHEFCKHSNCFDANITFDSQDDVNRSFSYALRGALLTYQNKSTETSVIDPKIFKELSSYLYVRAYNKFKAEGRLLSVYVDNNNCILNTWNDEAKRACSINTTELSKKLLSDLPAKGDDETSDYETLNDSLLNIDDLLDFELSKQNDEKAEAQEIVYNCSKRMVS